MNDKTVIEKVNVNGAVKNYPYALFSLFLGIISFIQLLGLERALAAVGFGVFALLKINRGGNPKGKKYAYWGIGLGIVYLVVLLAVVIYKGSDLLCILRQK